MWNVWTKVIVALTTLALTAGSAVFVYNKGKRSGMQQVQTLWDSERASLAEAVVREVTLAQAREKELQEIVDNQRRAHRNEVNRLARERDAALDSLRNRPDRPAESGGGLSSGANIGLGTPSGCTGAQLYRPDAELLIGIAGEADQLRVALGVCLAHAAEVERQLNGAPRVE